MARRVGPTRNDSFSLLEAFHFRAEAPTLTTRSAGSDVGHGARDVNRLAPAASYGRRRCHQRLGVRPPRACTVVEALLSAGPRGRVTARTKSESSFDEVGRKPDGRATPGACERVRRGMPRQWCGSDAAVMRWPPGCARRGRAVLGDAQAPKSLGGVGGAGSAGDPLRLRMPSPRTLGSRPCSSNAPRSAAREQRRSDGGCAKTAVGARAGCVRAVTLLLRAAAMTAQQWRGSARVHHRRRAARSVTERRPVERWAPPHGRAQPVRSLQIARASARSSGRRGERDVGSARQLHAGEGDAASSLARDGL